MSKAQAKSRRQDDDDASSDEEVTNKKQKSNNGGSKNYTQDKSRKRSPSNSDSDSYEESKGKSSQRPSNGKGRSNDSDDEDGGRRGGSRSDNRSSGSYEAFVKGLPYSSGEDDLRKFFKSCGTVDSINLLKGHDGRSKGIAFVKFTDEDALQSAIALSGSELGGRSLLIEKTTPREQRQSGGNDRGFQQRSEKDPDSTTVFVGNLSYSTTEDSLREFFEDCGEIEGVRIAMDQQGNMRGFAHVDFRSSSSVEGAVQKAGSKLDGRAIKVDYSSSKKQDRGGRDGGGRSFGGGNSYGGRNGGSGGGRGGFRGGRR